MNLMEKEAIISEIDIINTYPEKNQKLSFLYFKYLELKKHNPSFGYKRLSKLLNEPIYRTRSWHHTNSIPVPILNINWLKDKSILPLTFDNPKLHLIARIL